MVVQGLGDVNKGVVKCYRKIKREVGGQSMASRSNSSPDRKVKENNSIFFNGIQRKTNGGQKQLDTLFGYIGRKYMVCLDKNTVEVRYFFIPAEVYKQNPEVYREQLIMPNSEEVHETLRDFLTNREGFCEGLEQYEIKTRTVMACVI